MSKIGGKILKDSLIVLVLILTLLYTSNSKAQDLTANDIVSKIRDKQNRIRDLQGKITINSYLPNGQRQIIKAKVMLKQPKEVRLEYLSPELFADQIIISNGDKVWMFLPLSEEWKEFNIGDLPQTREEQMDILNALLIRVDDYNFELLGKDTLDKQQTYCLRLMPKKDEKKSDSLRMWVEAERILPLNIEEYDERGNFLGRITFGGYINFGDDVWLPLLMYSFDANGSLAIETSFEGVKLNSGLDEKLFEPPKGAISEDW